MKPLHFLFFYFILSVQLNFGQINKSEIVQEFENKADTLYKYFKYDSASVYYCKAAELYEQQQNWLPCVKNYRLTSNAKIKAAKFDKALYYSGKAFDLAKRYFKENNKNEMLEKSDILINKADLYENKGKYDQELVTCKEALKLILSVDSSVKLKIAGVWNKMGVSYMALAKYDSAMIFCKSALDERIELLGKNDAYVAESYYCVGKIYDYKGEYDNALEFCQKALNIWISAYGENHPSIASAYCNMGITYVHKGEYDKALEFFQKDLRIRILIYGETHPKVAMSYNNIGNIYQTRRDDDKALEYHQKALRLRILFYGEKHPDVAISYTNIGNIYYNKGEYNKALEFYQKALNISISILGENHPDVAMRYNNIGAVYSLKGDYDKALEFYQKALHSWITVYGEKHPDVAMGYNNIAEISYFKREYNKALEYHQKVVDLKISIYGNKHPDVAMSYNSMGEICSSKGEDSMALQFYQKALMANILDFNDSSIFKNPKLAKILSEYELQRSLTGKATAFYQLYKNKTKSYRDIEAALSTYEVIFQLISMMRHEYDIEDTKLLLSDTNKCYYKQAMHIALEFDRINPSNENRMRPFRFIEEGKSAALTARFNEYKARHFAGIPDSLLVLEKELETRIGSYTTQIKNMKFQKGYDTLKVNMLENRNFTCSRKLDSIITYFEKDYPAYYELKYANKTVTIPEIQKSLDHNSAILNYFVGDSSLFIVAITDSLYNIQEVTIDSSFIKLVTNYYKDIKTAETGSFVNESQKLYQILIKPVKDYITGKDHLIIIPDDYLYYVPFETLVNNTSSSKIINEDYSQLDYLIKSHSISYHHSATLWYNSYKNENKTTAKIKLNFIGFAPVFSNEKNNGLILSSNISVLDTSGNSTAYRSISSDMKKFNPLPYSKDEVISIVKLFEKRRKEAKAYLYSEASEGNFKYNSGNFSIIHVSSHGFSNDREPDLSGIVFSQPTDISDKEDGILYTGETYNLNLKADLIVLSSCDGGIGKLIKGEGLQALSRGFLYAGAPNVIFSLWKALDKGTKDLMVQFYLNVLDGKSYSESLRTAKLKIINDPKTAFPHFWGGFVLVGR